MGVFKEGLRDGFGTYINEIGIGYEGEFENDKRHGKGRILTKTFFGNISYNIQYERDKIKSVDPQHYVDSYYSQQTNLF